MIMYKVFCCIFIQIKDKGNGLFRSLSIFEEKSVFFMLDFMDVFVESLMVLNKK